MFLPSLMHHSPSNQSTMAMQDGSAEYKRQVHKQLSSTRLRTLSTQMSYRLDEGKGRCTYHIGVEDDGCHSLLDYPSVSESAWILESIARSLNSVVLERKMIQNEIKEDGDNEELRLVDDQREVIVVEEPPVLGIGSALHNMNNDEEMKEEKGKDICLGGNAGKKKKSKLCTDEGFFTRCELTIQRVETHLLDPSPLSLSSLSRCDTGGSSFGEGIEGAIDATELCNKVESSLAINPAEEDKSPTNGSKLLKLAAGHDEPEATSVEETLSSRNIRVAVVGNVDAGKSTLIGTLTTSHLDDGRGSSRTAIMKHRHEIESGRTSTSSSHLLGFRSSGEAIAGKDKVRSNKMKSEDEIARASYRVITLRIWRDTRSTSRRPSTASRRAWPTTA